MQKLKIEDPQTFEFASIVTKQSKTGFSSNRRLLVVRGGHLYYFSTIPSFFNGNPKTLQYHHELPKHSLQILNIKRIKPNQATSCTFELTFDECFLMEREDIRKTLVDNMQFVPKKKGQEITWRFTCDNNAVKSKWVSYLAQLKEHFSKEKEKIDKFFVQIDNSQKQQMKSNYSNMSKSSKTPWRQSTMMRKQYSNNDLKSMGDLTGTEMDHYFDPPFKGNAEQYRLTGSYNPQVNVQDFNLQENLTMTDPGFKPKEIKMHKLGSTELGTKKSK